MEIKCDLSEDRRREYLYLFKLILDCLENFTDRKDEAMQISHLYWEKLTLKLSTSTSSNFPERDVPAQFTSISTGPSFSWAYMTTLVKYFNWMLTHYNGIKELCLPVL